MSRKNNKSIKKRYIEHLKELQRKQQERKEEKIKNRQDNEAVDDAEQMLENMGIDEGQKMEIEKRKKIKKIKKVKKAGDKKKKLK